MRISSVQLIIQRRGCWPLLSCVVYTSTCPERLEGWIVGVRTRSLPFAMWFNRMSRVLETCHHVGTNWDYLLLVGPYMLCPTPNCRGIYIIRSGSTSARSGILCHLWFLSKIALNLAFQWVIGQEHGGCGKNTINTFLRTCQATETDVFCFWYFLETRFYTRLT
jgi:hypothetical protein